MKKLFILFIAIFLNAAYISTITNVKGLNVKLDRHIREGISGVVLCPYENEKIICAKAISLGNYARLYTYENLKNDAFALPLVYPKKGNKIIFGKNYHRMMIIAPNQNIYLSLKNRFKHLSIIPIDVFAAFLDDEVPTKEDFVEFANKMDIGLYIFVLDKIYLVDANTLYVLNEEDSPFNIKRFKKPFYSSYRFDIKKENMLNYYKNILKGTK